MATPSYPTSLRIPADLRDEIVRRIETGEAASISQFVLEAARKEADLPPAETAGRRGEANLLPPVEAAPPANRTAEVERLKADLQRAIDGLVRLALESR